MKALLNTEFKCLYCGRVHKIDIKEIIFGKIEQINEFIKKFFLIDSKILILCDNITWEVAGKKINNILDDFERVPLILKNKGEKRIIAKYEYFEKIEENIKDKNINLLLTVGTGSITDLGKLVGNRYQIPVMSFPTAPSMNGYTSPVSAYIKDGVKITVPVSPCKYIYVDDEIISNAPIELIKAGFADSLAKSFANADWKISSIILEEKFCQLPYQIVSKAEREYIDKGDLILKRDKEFIHNLMETLNLGGISMIIAGSSAPASGGEHLISHFLDMYAYQNNMEPFAYHGLQVGIGVYFCSLVYEKLKELNDLEISKKLNQKYIDYNEKEKVLTSLFNSSKELLKEIFKKKVNNVRKMKEKLVERWDDIKKTAFTMIYTPNEIKNFLNKGNCPTHLNEIVLDDALIHKILTLSRFIRDRITILDIADEIGLLDEIVKGYIKGNL